MAESPLKSSQGAVFIQLEPGAAPEYFCSMLDAIAEPAGDETLIQRRDANGQVITIGSTKGAPGAVTTGVTAKVFPSSDILDRIKDCYVNVFSMSRCKGKADIFANYERGWAVWNARVTTRTYNDTANMDAAEEVVQTRKFDIAGWALAKIRHLLIGQQTIAETTALNSIAVCGIEECASDCGPAVAAGQNLITVGDAPTGSPTDRAGVGQTDDAGNVWFNEPGAAGHPFLAGFDGMSI